VLIEIHSESFRVVFKYLRASEYEGKKLPFVVACVFVGLLVFVFACLCAYTCIYVCVCVCMCAIHVLLIEKGFFRFFFVFMCGFWTLLWMFEVILKFQCAASQGKLGGLLRGLKGNVSDEPKTGPCEPGEWFNLIGAQGIMNCCH
jgi:hypothetical protein